MSVVRPSCIYLIIISEWYVLFYFYFPVSFACLCAMHHVFLTLMFFVLFCLNITAVTYQLLLVSISYERET